VRSCNAMRSCVVMALLSACGSDKGPMRPVDAKFRATVEGDGVPAGSVVSVDVFWLGDGYVDIRLADVDGVVPGPDELKGVLLKDGNEVLNDGPVPSDGGEFQVRLEGVIAPEAFELDLTVDGAAVRLAGDPRPFGDASALDGEYLVRGDNFPGLCPGETQEPRGRNLPLDVLETEDGARLTLDGRPSFDLPVGESHGTVVIRDAWYGGTFEASVDGSVEAGSIALMLEVPNENAGPGCVDRLTLTGGKRLPDPASLDGEWRATYDWTDGCFDERGHFAAPVRVIPQDDGRFDFFDMDGDSWVQFDLAVGQPFGGEFFDYGGTWAIITYDGQFDPPDLAYTVTYAFNGPDGPCTVDFDVTAYKRFFFPEE
jgi:hypothetical protein